MVYRLLLCTFLIFCFLNSCTYDEYQINKSNNSVREIHKDEILDKVLSMSIDEKIGQLFIVGFDGDYSLTNQDIHLIRDLKVGGLIFFGKNILTSNQTVNLINEIKGINSVSNSVPLFLAIDQEGGLVTRLPNEILKFDKASSIGQKNDESYAYNSARIMGDVLYKMGFNMNFAPVLDVYTNPNNKVIGSRAFSSDKEVVSKMAIQTMNGLKESGIISVGKHYPGHGDTDEDSHYELPVLQHDYNRLKEIELYPFKQAINNGLDAILVSHLLYKNIDENITTLSNRFLYDILRKDLKFRGIVVTDDMIMKGITNDNLIPEASVKAIKAGTDIILIGSGYENIVSSIEMVKNAIVDGEINESDIDRKVYNILSIKRDYNLNNNEIPEVDVSEINQQIKYLLNQN